MPLPHDLCARVQNAFRAHHRQVCVQHTTQNLGILSILLRAGFISNLTRGTVDEPSPEKFMEARPVDQRIWADLKYRDSRPVMSYMSLVSKPSKRIFMDLTELRLVCTGRRAQNVKPLGMGEIAIVQTNDKENEWLEAREALQMRLCGHIVCRAQ
ncbi:ribosomal protein S8 [Fistulina hepatica ATCC 64428]|nr:ribosomal protein S8 [Fistulina hepatica ATCC 64428]